MNNIDFGFYASIFRKRLPFFLAVVVLVGLGGLLLTSSLPRVYQATAKILVESPQIPDTMAKSTVPTGATEQFQIIQEDVLSRQNLIALADRFHVYGDRADMSDMDIAEDMQNRIIVEPVQTGAAPSAAVYHIAFNAADPQLAASVANELVSMILRKDVELRTGRATDTTQFFTQETKRLDSELKAQDSRILQFKNDHVDALPDSLNFRRDQQSTQQQTLLALTQEEATLRRRQADLQSRRMVPGAVAVTPEEKSLEDMRGALFSQLAVFAEDSPVIKSLRTRIRSLEGQIRGDRGTSPQPSDNTPMLSSADLELASISDRLKAIAEQRAAIAKTNDELSASIIATPGNETALNSMLRDERNIQEQYNSAVARLAEASTGEQIELRLKGERLSLIESAVPPQSPISPKPKLLLAGTIGAALALGLAVLLLPELLNKSIRRPVELINKMDIRPIVTIPYITTNGERNKRRFASMAMIVAILGAIPLLLLALHSYVPPVDALMNKTLGGFGMSEANGKNG